MNTPLAPNLTPRQRRSADTGPPTAAGSAKLSEGTGGSLIVLLIAVLLIPRIAGFEIGGMLITPERAFLLVMALPTVALMMRRGRLYAFDWCMLSFGLWTAFVVLVKEGASGIEQSGQFLLETVVVYFLVQGAITRPGQVRLAFDLMFWTVVVLGVAAIPEALNHKHYLLDLVRVLKGLPPLAETIGGERLGLTRAATIFAHPILYGIYCATLLSMVWYLTPGRLARVAKATVITGAAFLSVSSAAVLVIGLQFALIFAEWLTRGIGHRIAKMAWATVALVVALNLFTGRGVSGTILLFSFSKESAFTRMHIWENGIDDVLRSPLIGIVPDTWTRPVWLTHSIDNYWLFQAMDGGLPSVVLVLAAIGLIARRLFRRPDGQIPPVLARMRRGWGFLMLALVFCGMTVHFFDKAQLFFALMIAFGGALARLMAEWEAEAGASRSAAPQVRQQRRSLL